MFDLLCNARNSRITQLIRSRGFTLVDAPSIIRGATLKHTGTGGASAQPLNANVGCAS
jgi:hypothetical protein